MSMNAADALRLALRKSILLTDLQHARLQARLMAALLAGALMFDLLDPAVLLLAGPRNSILDSTVAGTALGPLGFGIVFLALAALLLPFLGLQLWCWEQRRRLVMKLTCLVLAIAALAWFFLGWRCMHLHFGIATPIVFLRTGAGTLACSFALAFSLNAERLRIWEQPSC